MIAHSGTTSRWWRMVTWQRRHNSCDPLSPAPLLGPSLESVAATALRLGLCRSKVYGLIADGEDLEAVNIGKSRRVVIDSTLTFIERKRAEAAAARSPR